MIGLELYMPMYVRMVKEVEFASSCFVFTEAAAADLENWSQNGGKIILLAMACFSNQCASTEPGLPWLQVSAIFWMRTLQTCQLMY